MTKVLITGMSGLIGGLLRNRLEATGGYELSALNRSEVEGVECYRVDIADFDAVRAAFEGKDVVVHLAAYLGSDDFEGQLRGNIVGTYNVFEAARLAGVKRVVFASSGNAIRGFERVEPYRSVAAGEYEGEPGDFPPITHEMIRPEGIYGAAKVFGEALGRYYSDAYGLSVLCVRIGRVTKGQQAGCYTRSLHLSEPRRRGADTAPMRGRSRQPEVRCLPCDFQQQVELPRLGASARCAGVRAERLG